MNPLCIFQVLIYATTMAAWQGLGDSGVDSSDSDTEATWLADPRQEAAEDTNRAICAAAGLGLTERLRVLLENPSLDPGADDNAAICMAAANDHAGCVRLLLEDPRVDSAEGGSRALLWAAKNNKRDCIIALLEDPRVDPEAAFAIHSGPTRTFIWNIGLYKDANLETFQQEDPASIPFDDALDVLIFRNQASADVLDYLYGAQLRYLGIPETAQEFAFYKALIHTAKSSGVVLRIRDLHKITHIIKAFDIFNIFRTIRHYDTT